MNKANNDSNFPAAPAIFTLTKLNIYVSLIGTGLVLLFGFIGNLSSLITFTSKKLRSISTSMFFIGVTLADILYLFPLIYDFIITGILGGIIDRNYISFCHFRTFITQTTCLISSWLLVLISIDRWIRARFLTQSKRWCIRKYALIEIGFIIISSILTCSHILTPLFGDPNNKFFCIANMISPNYLWFFNNIWPIFYVILQIFLPTLLMLTALIDMYIIIRFHRLRAGGTQHSLVSQQQMFLLTFSSICIFVLTTLPNGIYMILASRSLLPTTVFYIVQLRSILILIQSLNYSSHFYIHCLTSQFFREEYRKRIIRKKNTVFIQNSLNMVPLRQSTRI